MPGSRQLETLERLLAISAPDLEVALTHASDHVAAALRADKVDAFLYDPARDTLVAIGRSTQPLSAQQRRHGLDVLPVANGGRTIGVFRTGIPFLTGRLDEDPEELRGVTETLKIRSTLGVPLEVNGKRRGVLMIASLQPDFWTEDDVRFAEAVARWVSMVAHRAELMTTIEKNALEQGRQRGAEELVTILAHDLRNFISPIDLALDVLAVRAEKDGRDADTKALARARRSLNRLSALVTDLLDVARLEHGIMTLEREQVALDVLVKEVAALFSSPERAVNVLVRNAPRVDVDSARVRQCLENLVSNALKHSPANAPVDITVASETTLDGAIASVSVRNEGPGVPVDVLPRIFERFVTGGGERGLGLGLFLARRIATMHGGDIAVASSPGEGARFTLTLPCAPT